MAAVTAPVAPHQAPQPTRPHDVVTGCWLWAAAVPPAVTGYLVNNLTAPVRTPSGYVTAVAVLMVVVVTAIVVAFLPLLWQGYRWARSLLTGGAVASVMYLSTNLFVADRGSAAAIGYAVCAIVGSVLLGGGVYLLHRADSHPFFAR